MSDWRDIDTYEQDPLGSDVVHLRDDEGNEAIGSFGFEEADWDNVWGAWHLGDDINIPLGFEPTQWKPLCPE